MVQTLSKCPDTWRKGCFPHPCSNPPKPVPPTPQPAKVHNIVYLVDEHNVSGLNQDVKRNGPTLRKRYAWHYQAANLTSFNVGEKPNTIQLHEKIANPGGFQWEGFMFDIPGGQSTLRVAIVANADLATDKELTGPGGDNGAQIDRVVGFAGTYPDAKVPFGPIVQVRRDDSYRFLGASLDGPVKVVWRCAYYITKDTPKGPTPHAQPFGGSFTLLPEGNPDALSYDQIMDSNVDDKVAISEEAGEWGGENFGFEISEDAPDGTMDDDPDFRAQES